VLIEYHAIDKDAKHARDKRIFDLWLACYTQDEIGDTVGVSKMEVSRTCNEMAKLPENYKPQ
jgi:DNA-directed RNA polymerase specialized sigma subunit